MQTPWDLEISKSYLKFSAAHMTVYPDGTKEAIHGHNYQVSLRVFLSEADGESLVDFATFKEPLKELCAAWDEKMLIQAKSPHAKIAREGASVRLTLCGKDYLFPADEVVLLPVTNVTSELLAREMAEALKQRLAALAPRGSVRGFELTVLETEGQGASYRVSL